MEISSRKFVDTIVAQEIKDFTEKALEAYGTQEKLKVSNKVCDVLYQMLVKRKFAGGNQHEVHVDILLSAALLHNLFFDPKDWTTLYDARQQLNDLAVDCGLRGGLIDLIFDTVESQMGEDTPVVGSKPKPNTPQEFFSNAVWFVTEYRDEEEI